MLLTEQGREALAPFPPELQVLVSGILMLAHDFWQDASPYMQKRYPQYALPWREFAELSRRYERDVGRGHAIDLEDIREFIAESVGLYGFKDDEVMDTTAQGKNLRNVATLLCVSGLPAQQGDLEVLLRRLRSLEFFSADYYEALVLPENRIACTRILNPLFEVAAHRYAALAQERNCSWVHPIAFKDGCVGIDPAVIGTGYLLYRSVLEFLEPVRGRA